MPFQSNADSRQKVSSGAKALEPAPATVPAATEENQHYQDDDEEGGGVHVALPGASVPYGLHLFNVHWGVSP